MICDLEAVAEISEQVEGSDAVVFAAGAGPGSGPERKRTVDLGGATKLIDACKATGVRRYVMVSAIGVSRPGSISAEMKPYYDAKREADEALSPPGSTTRSSAPGGSPTTRAPAWSASAPRSTQGGEVTRDDVAATLVAVLDEPRSAGLAFDLINGETEIAAALASLLSPPAP